MARYKSSRRRNRSRNRRNRNRSTIILSNPASGSSIMGWAVLAIGGYFILKYFGINPLGSLLGTSVAAPGVTTSQNQIGTPTTTTQGGTIAVTPTTPATTQPTGNTTTPPATTTGGGTIIALIANAMRANGDDPMVTHSADQWNYYYAMVRNIPGPDPAVVFPGNPRDQYYTFQEWWSVLSSNGFSGLGGLDRLGNATGFGGMGAVVRMNPFMPDVGNNLAPLGSEKFVKFIN